MASKKIQIAEKLDAGIKPAQIVKDLNTTQSYVYAVKAELAKLRRENGDEVEDDPAHAALTVNEDDFVQKIQLQPDKEVLTDTKKETESPTETYVCSQCGKEWTADANEYQAECPECGVEF